MWQSSARGEGGVVEPLEIIGRTGWRVLIAGQKRRDVFRPTHATEELVDAQAIGAVEPGAGLGHQAKVRGRVQ